MTAIDRENRSKNRSNGRPSRMKLIESLGSQEISRRDLLKASGAVIVGFSLLGQSAVWPEGVAAQSATGVIPPDLLDSWIAIDPEGNVTLFTGKVELGTGVQTALAQIAAEELDVAFERMTVVQGDTALTVDQGITAGSQTIARGGVQVRQAAADARQVLLQLASERLEAPVDQLSVADGLVAVAGDPLKQVTYGELVGGQKFTSAVTGSAPVKTPDQYTIVGRPIARMDIPAKVTGEPAYVVDVRVPGMLHARTVKPPTIGAMLISVDEGSVQNLPGLVKVVVKGNFVAVVTEREEQAIEAAGRLRVSWSDWSGLPRMEDQFSALRAGPSVLNVIKEQGDMEGTLASAAKTVRSTYLYPYQTHGSIGPSCAVADVRDGQATIWSGTQRAHDMRRTLSGFLDIPVEDVRVIWVSPSGIYGSSGEDDAMIDAALISQAVGRPVRLQWTREEEHRWSSAGPAMAMDLRGGLDDQGRIVAWDYEAYSRSHYYLDDWLTEHLILQEPMVRDGPPSPFPLWGGEARTAYVFDGSEREVVHQIQKSPIRSLPLRAPGQGATTFATEGFMDELAAAAGADPVAFRLAHLTSDRIIAVLKAAAERAGWDTRPGPKPADGARIATGRGIAVVQRPAAPAPAPQTLVAMVAEVTVDRETGAVALKRAVVAHDCGLIINPDGLRNQIEGNVIQTTSRTLKEEVTFDSGNITSLDWESYPILTFKEVPQIDIVLIDRPDLPASGAGEPSACPVTAAIANAIFDATGARLHQTPFTPVRVKAALAPARS